MSVPNVKSGYRPDIDALRAVAVLLVVFYHAGLSYFAGGFIGVDVFFVISGYLITGIILKRLAAGTFSFVEFYANRIRRILPALFFLCFCAMLIGWLLYAVPDDLKFLQRTIKRTVLAVSNFYFYFNTGYFDAPAAKMPMLHTWSLAVEEQFYLIFPLLLFIICTKFRKHLLASLGVLLLLSFVFSACYVFANQKFAFYMLPSRAWELMLGGILAVTAYTPASQRMKSVFSISGLLIICATALAYDRLVFWPFPGLSALLPCLGTFLCISGGAGRQGLRWLNNRVLVFIGLISYSLYLWHWPIFVFYKQAFLLNELSGLAATALIALSILVATFSWKFVEQPVRFGAFFRKRRVVFPGAACALLVLLALAGLRVPYLLTSSSYGDVLAEERYVTGQIGAEGATPEILLLGDSHAAVLGVPFDRLGKEYGTGVRLLESPHPLLHAYRPLEANTVEDQREIIQNIFAAEQPYDTVFLLLRWSYYLHGPLPHEDDSVYPAHLNYENGNNTLTGRAALLAALRDTLDYFKETGVRRVVIILPIPEQEYSIPQSAAQLARTLSEDEINERLGLTWAQYQERNAEMIDLLRSMEEAYDFVEILDPAPYLLNPENGRFWVVTDGKSLYRDDDHLSYLGAEWLAGMVEPFFKR